jgi:hypothetical protein
MNTSSNIRTSIVHDALPNKLLRFLALVVMALPIPHSCPAQGTIYASRAAFTGALASSTTITFEGLSPTLMGSSPVNVAGVSFTNAEHQLCIVDWSQPPSPMTSDGQVLWNFDSSYPVGIFLPAGVTAFGADFSGGIEPNSSFNATLTVNMAGGQSYAYGFSAPRGTWTFFGITLAQPIASLVYDDGGPPFPVGFHEEMLDNVTFGSAIPEPSSSLLTLCVLMTLLCGRRSRPTRPDRGMAVS